MKWFGHSYRDDTDIYRDMPLKEKKAILKQNTMDQIIDAMIGDNITFAELKREYEYRINHMNDQLKALNKE